MILSHNPPSHQIPPESLFFSDNRTLVARCLPIYFVFHSCLILSFLAIFARACMSVAAFTFEIHGDAFHLAPRTSGFRLLRFHPPVPVHEASDVVSSMSFIFLEDCEHTSSKSPAMEDEHDSTNTVSRGPVQCLVALDPPSLDNILALSLSL